MSYDYRLVTGTLLGDAEHAIKATRNPLLGPEEAQWIIGDHTEYFAEVYRAEQIRSGEQLTIDTGTPEPYTPTPAELQVARVRREKGDLFVDRAIEATYAFDTTRSYLGHLSGRDIVRVDGVDDTAESQMHRISDYVANALNGYLIGKPDREGHKAQAADALAYEVFGNDRVLTTRMTELAKHAAWRRLVTWMDQLVMVTSSLSFFDKNSENKLYNYNAKARPEVYKNEPDLQTMLANRKRIYSDRRAWQKSRQLVNNG